ncbi:uncharacterized protein BJX67DRAFT_383185 [Aspergillus lucknowensis]|uniref:Uncharacterized protein n=1 Tax=Aspergillus lucknowensis TaxID=176173 RepID=A0ABR4LKW4_9EURO
MYRQLPSQEYQTSLNAAILASALQNGRPSRPISWHPALRQQEYRSHFFSPTTTVNSRNLPATRAYPQPRQILTGAFEDESVLQSFASSGISTSHMESFGLSTADSHLPIQHPTNLQVSNPQLDGASWNEPTSGIPSDAQLISNEWPFDMMSINQSISSVGAPASINGSVSSPGRLTEPDTPDLLPIQQFGDYADGQSVSVLEKPEPEDELVGMGLYNHPESFAEGPSLGMNGKGLKLEETFTPSSDNEADENDDEDDKQQESEETLSRVNNSSQTQQRIAPLFEVNKQPNKPAESMMQKSFFFEDDVGLQQRVVTDPQQSFNIGSTSCMNYGYGWI